MLSRMKFEIDQLVEEMLDHLADTVWSSDTATFFDPAIGGGQFVRAIEQRLRAHGHSDSNIRKRVFGFEESELHIRYAVNKHKLVGQYAKKPYDKFLEMDDTMKFDVVIGNPPYQKETAGTRLGSRGSADLWPDFVRKNISLLKDNGHLAIIHPTAWRKPEDRNGFWKMLTQDNQMKRLVMSSGKKEQDWFGIGVRVDYYILEKTPRYTTTEIVDHENISYNLDLSQFEWLPNYAIAEISKMLGRGCKVLYNTFYHTQKDHTEYPNKLFKYPVVHTINQSGLGIRYFDKTQPQDVTHFGISKVLLNQNELQYPYNDYKGEYGMSQLTFGIAINSKQEGDEIIEFLNSEKGRRVIAATKWNTFYTDYGMFKSFKKDWYK
jgi:SAM-dependent methyltransferase